MGIEQIKIELMDTAGGDLSVVNSARVSFDKESDFEYYTAHGTEGVLSKKDKGLIKYLADHKHLTTFRHNFIQLRCHAPIFLVRQLGKHQAGLSWSEISRRYVDSEPEFFMPDEWRGRPDGSIKQGSGELKCSNELVVTSYEIAMESASNEYNALLDLGVAPEMARMVLPQSMMTSWVWSGNLLSFAHVYKERINAGAQLEAQHFAVELNKIIRPLFPVSWSALVGEG